MMNWIGFLKQYKNLELVEPNNPPISFCGYDIEDTLECICYYVLGLGISESDMSVSEKGRVFLVHCLNCHPCIDEFRRVYESLLYSLDDYDPPESDFFDNLSSF